MCGLPLWGWPVRGIPSRVNPVFTSLLRPFVRPSRSLATGLGAARPDDAPKAHAPGIDPDRILLFGNGAAVGWGVRSHELALPGQLARRIAAITGRGADVIAVADPAITVRSAAHALPAAGLDSYDAIVIVLGVSDALHLTSARRWENGLSALFDEVDAHASDCAEIVVVGIHRPSSIAALSVHEGSAVDRHAARLDSITRRICGARSRTHFVEPPELPTSSDDRTRGSGPAVALFELWAHDHAALLAPLLDSRVAHGRSARQARNQPQALATRLEAIRRLGLLDSPPEKRFDDITERARILLGTTGAAFSVVDEDRLFNKSFSGAGTVEVPLRGAMCAVTIQSGMPFVVPDVWSDDRFVTHPSVRFYAGYPVETSDGIRIGALCVTDPNPRTVDSVDLVLLRELALTVQRELAQTPIAA